MDHVAKALVSLDVEGVRCQLLSLKRAPGERKHGKLELLGGHVEGSESAFDALIRELLEEELSGELARVAGEQRPRSSKVLLPSAVYHLFELSLAPRGLGALEHNARESLGFVFLREADLFSPSLAECLTKRTTQVMSHWHSR